MFLGFRRRDRFLGPAGKKGLRAQEDQNKNKKFFHVVTSPY
jgi:hypothetical protein